MTHSSRAGELSVSAPTEQRRLRVVLGFLSLALASCATVTPAPRSTPEPLDPVEIVLAVPAGESLAYRVSVSVSMGAAPPREQTQTYFLEHAAYEANVESALVVREGDVTDAETQSLRPLGSMDAFVRSAFPTPPGPVDETPIENTWSPGQTPWGPPAIFRDSFQLTGKERGNFLLSHRRQETRDGVSAGQGVGRHVWSPLGMYVEMQETMETVARRPGRDDTVDVSVTIVKTLDPGATRARSAFLQRVAQARSEARATFDVESVGSPEAEVLAALTSRDEAALEILRFHVFGHPVRTLTQVAALDESLRQAFFESELLGEISWPASILAPLRVIEGDSPSASRFLEAMPTYDLDALRATALDDPELVTRAHQALQADESMRDPAALLEVLIEKLEAFPESSRGRHVMGTILVALTYRDLGANVGAWRTYLREHRDRPYVEWLLEVAREESPEPAMLAMQQLSRVLMFDAASPNDGMRAVAAAKAQSDSPLVRVVAAELLLRLGDTRGLALTVEALSGALAPRTRAFTNLAIVAPSTFGFRMGDPELERAVACARIEAWVDSL